MKPYLLSLLSLLLVTLNTVAETQTATLGKKAEQASGVPTAHNIKKVVQQNNEEGASEDTKHPNSATTTEDDGNLSDAEVGRLLFFDTNLSRNRTMSCATCHEPSGAFSDQRRTLAKQIVSRGSTGNVFGVRNAPTVMYANTSPTFHFDSKFKEFIGGQFWDGRASTLAQQAMGPPTNPAEMNMPTEDAVVARLLENPIYVKAFKASYGDDIFYIQKSYSKYRKFSDLNITPNAYIAMGNFIEAFEKTAFFAPFDSKYDRYLAGKATLTAAEEAGRKLFFDDPGVNCRNCHMQKNPGDEHDAFTNHLFRNVGTPANPDLLKLPGEQKNFVDNGMMDNSHANTPEFRGKIKVPTLRDVAVTQPYMHNGVFRHLRTVIAFFDHYNNPSRGLNPETGKPWAVPEVSATLNKEALKGRALSDQEIDALIAFLQTLTDQRYEHIDVKDNL